MTPKVNLRGQKVTFRHPTTQAPIRGKVITHIRDNRWMIESSRLPKTYTRNGAWFTPRRIVLPREDFEVNE